MGKINPSTMKVFPQTKTFIRKIQGRHLEKYGSRVSYERILIAIERLFSYDPQLYNLLLNKELK